MENRENPARRERLALRGRLAPQVRQARAEAPARPELQDQERRGLPEQQARQDLLVQPEPLGLRAQQVLPELTPR